MSNLVLSVDDDPMVHKLLEFTLRNEDFDTATTLSAEEAQEFLNSDAQDVLAIILDWEMPGMDGLEFLKWLKTQERYKDIPVIMLTGRSKREEIQMGIDAGAYYYVTKPFSKDLLLSILRSAINEFNTIRKLSDQVQNAKNPLSSLRNGTFHIKTIEEAQKLSIFIANASPMPQESLMICELFNNAIEHGNLGITYEEKTDLVDSDALTDEIERRLNSPEYGEKYATVNFLKGDSDIRVVIEDMGNGFEYQKYLHFDEDRVFDNHGRGIAMANTMLNIEYKGKGNIVEVSIPLHMPEMARA